MKNNMKFEMSRKQKRRESSTLGTQRWLSMARNVYGKIRYSKSGNCFPVHGTAEMLRNQEIRVEQEKAEAIKPLSSKLTIL